MPANLHLYVEHVDMAVRLGALPDSSMISTRIGSMATLVCASPDLLEAHGTPQHPGELAHLPCVVFDGPATATWAFRDGDSKAAFTIDIARRLSVTSAGAAVRAAVRHTGFTRVYRYHCADELRSGSLLPVLGDFELEPVPVHLVHAERSLLPLKVRAFLDFAASRLRFELSKMRAEDA